MTNAPLTDRLVGLDFYRILAVLFIFLFHSNIHIHCQYGFLTPFINMGAIYMTAFFLLSGFSLYLTWSKRDLHDIEGIKKFYLKRMIGILPLYYAIAVLYIFLLGKETPVQNLLIAPTEILGIQSTFNGLFSVTHNGGTWFVSCILLCYLVYPFIQEITKQIETKSKILLICVLVIILLHSPIVVGYFKTSGIYSNPFFRILEFTIGALLCSMMADIKESKISKILFSWWAVIVEYGILISGVTIALKIGIPRNYMLYSWVALPMFMLLIVSMTGLSFPKWMQNSKIIGYLCEISYAFFFAQYFTWKTTVFIIRKIGFDANILRIVIGFVSCSIYTILLHEIIEKPITKLLKKRFL